MSRKAFQQGLGLYQEGRYQDALEHFTKALEYDVPNKYLILDSRSSTYFKLGETKKSLQDAKMTIEVAPERWQGYARAARVFFQINKLNASLTMVDMALSRLKEEDTKRRASLASLKLEVEAAQRVSEAHRQRFTDHMGRLPVELFSEIASMLVGENEMSPIVLSHVSRQWREVIHGLPRLWDTLLLTKKRPVQKTKFWIEKSRGKIKELSIRSSVLDVPWAGNHLELLQWGYLRVLKVQRWDKLISLGLLQNLSSLHNVEQFETDGICGIDICSFLIQDPVQDVNAAGSKLRSLCIALASKNLIVAPLGVQSLTSITLLNVLLGHDILEFLGSNPNLEHLVLQSVDSNPSSRQVVFPYLKTLSLRFMVPAAIAAAELPVLENLCFDTIPTASDFVSLLRSLAEKNSNNLTKLTVRSTSFPPEAIIPLLRISDALQTLEISNVSCLVPQVIEALVLAPPSSNSGDTTPSLVTTTSPKIICPHLTSIDFSSCPDVETGPLMRLVKSRYSNEASPTTEIDIRSIISLVIDFCPRIDSTWLQWFRARVPEVSCIYMKKNTKFRAS